MDINRLRALASDLRDLQAKAELNKLLQRSGQLTRGQQRKLHPPAPSARSVRAKEALDIAKHLPSRSYSVAAVARELLRGNAVYVLDTDTGDDDTLIAPYPGAEDVERELAHDIMDYFELDRWPRAWSIYPVVL